MIFFISVNPIHNLSAPPATGRVEGSYSTDERRWITKGWIKAQELGSWTATEGERVEPTRPSPLRQYGGELASTPRRMPDTMHSVKPTWARKPWSETSTATQSNEPASEHLAAADALIEEVAGAPAPAFS